MTRSQGNGGGDVAVAASAWLSVSGSDTLTSAWPLTSDSLSSALVVVVA